MNGSGRASGSTSHGGITPSALWRKLGNGKTSVIVLPVFDYVTMLLEAGAEVRPLGQMPFLDVESGRTAPHPSNLTCFILLRVKPWIAAPFTHENRVWTAIDDPAKAASDQQKRL